MSRRNMSERANFGLMLCEGVTVAVTTTTTHYNPKNPRNCPLTGPTPERCETEKNNPNPNPTNPNQKTPHNGNALEDPGIREKFPEKTLQFNGAQTLTEIGKS